MSEEQQPSASLSAYAKHRGCSRQAVSKAIREGRLQRSVNLVDGRPTIPDFVAADEEWEENTREEWSGAGAREKHWKALLAELTYRKRADELVEAADVVDALSHEYSTARNALLGVPSKVKQRRPHLTLDDLATIDEVIREALTVLGTRAERVVHVEEGGLSQRTDT